MSPPSRGVGKDRVTGRNPHGLSVTATANRGFLLAAALVTCIRYGTCWLTSGDTIVTWNDCGVAA